MVLFMSDVKFSGWGCLFLHSLTADLFLTRLILLLSNSKPPYLKIKKKSW